MGAGKSYKSVCQGPLVIAGQLGIVILPGGLHPMSLLPASGAKPLGTVTLSGVRVLQSRSLSIHNLVCVLTQPTL